MNNFQFFSQRLIRLWQTIYNFSRLSGIHDAVNAHTLQTASGQKKNPSPITHHSQLISGFTLIELLVVASIIFILLSMSFAGYNSLNQRQKLITAGQNLKNTLRDAQSRAINTELDCSNCNCSISSTSSLRGWYVDFSNRQMYGECKSIVGPTITFSPRQFDAVAEITITPYITPAVKLFFRNYPPGVDQSATICLTMQGLPGSYYKISVNRAGSISDDGTIVTTCTP